jgi:hypothetical protein
VFGENVNPEHTLYIFLFGCLKKMILVENLLFMPSGNIFSASLYFCYLQSIISQRMTLILFVFSCQMFPLVTMQCHVSRFNFFIKYNVSQEAGLLV